MPTVTGNTNINGAFNASDLLVKALLIRDGAVVANDILCTEISGTGIYTAKMPVGLLASVYQVVFMSGTSRSYSEIAWDGDIEDAIHTPVTANLMREIKLAQLESVLPAITLVNVAVSEVKAIVSNTLKANVVSVAGETINSVADQTLTTAEKAILQELSNNIDSSLSSLDSGLRQILSNITTEINENQVIIEDQNKTWSMRI